eukprot:gene8553-8735_t
MAGLNGWFVAASDEVSRQRAAVTANRVQGLEPAAAATVPVDHSNPAALLSSAAKAARLLRGQNVMGSTVGINGATHLEDPWSVLSLGALPFLVFSNGTADGSAVHDDGSKPSPDASTRCSGVDAWADSDDEDDLSSLDGASISDSGRSSFDTPSSSPTRPSRRQVCLPNAPRRPRPLITILHSSDL